MASLGYIAADSMPYRIEWTGTSGTFVQHAFGQEPAKRMQMNYLHTQAGPAGYSKHLAWFIARDTNSFNILWLYLDNAGTDFACWLYQYPSNRLTYQKFVGNYRFTPPTATPPATLYQGIALRKPPPYNGPDFKFRDWERDLGTLDRLELYLPPAEGPVVGANPSPQRNGQTRAADRTLSALRVAPLHQIRVGEANGWKDGGWQELHCLAYDTSDDPYYLILYSNETTGFVVDIKHGLTYTADFGSKVQFSSDGAAERGADHTEGLGELRVRRYDWHDFSLRSTQKHANPYTEVNLLAEFVGPDGKKVQAPGFWDNNNQWKVRFSPQLVGDWSWRTRSNDPDLDGQAGVFECVAVDGKERAFFGANPNRSYARHFATRESKPVFPLALHDPVFNVSPEELKANSVPTATVATAAQAPLPASFTAFQKRVDAWAAKGVNRFVGGFLLDHDQFAAKTQANEGGVPFFDNDLDRPNPEFFHWMDRRIAYCSEHGIIPDIGLGWPSTGMFQKYSDVQLRRAWLSLLARYGAMDVSWNLFGDDGGTLPPGTEDRFGAFAGLTHLYDPGHHALTVMQKGFELHNFRIIDDSSAIEGAVRKITPMPNAPGAQNPPAPQTPRQPNLPDQTAPPRQAPPPVASVTYPWLDYLTLVGGSARALDLVPDDYQKPIVVWEDNGLQVKKEAVSPDITRHLLWESRMRNAYWVGSANSMAPASDPDVKMAMDCANFFRQTKWWRLEPHPEMLNGQEETDAERRRRQKAEDAALGKAGAVSDQRPNPNGGPPRSGGNRRPQGVQLLLADSGREYVAYLEHGGHITLDLIAMPGHLRFIWFNPRTGKSEQQPDIEGGDYATFVAPDSEDWVLYISRS